MAAAEVTVALRAVISDFQTKMGVVRGELDAVEKKHTSVGQAMAKTGGAILTGAATAAAAVGVASVKMAGDFQESMTTLVTGAGESQTAIKMVSDGILKLAPVVGESTKQLSDGMYMIESAGFHGAAGLAVLKASAEGAKVGGADLGTVANAVTTLLNDYHLSASNAADVTSKLVATVASGKTHMGDLADSLAAVAPAASAAHLSMNEVLGAMATMTAKGTPAADAATYLRQTILQLENPTAKAAKEMEALGLSSIDISSHLGQRGLTGTLAILTDAIQRKMGPAGTVLIEQLKKSSKHTTDFQKILANLPPAQQTFVGALADMVGGTKSMQAALELTGDSASVFQANVKHISETSKDAKGNVEGWGEVQKDFNFKLDQARATVETLGIKLGTILIPVVEKVAVWVGKLVVWFQKHKEVAKDLAIAIGVLAAAFVVAGIAAFIAGNLLTLGIGAAVAALTVAVIYLATHWKKVWAEIKHVFDEAVKFLRSGFGTLILLLLGPIGILAIIALHWQQIWRDMRNWTMDAVNAIVGFFTRLGHDIAAVFKDAIHWLEQAGKDIGNGLWAGIQWPWQHVIKPFFDGIKTLFVDFFTKGAGSWLLKVGKDVLNGLWAGIKWVWDNNIAPFFKAITGTAGTIVKFFAAAATLLYNAGKDILKGMWTGIKWVWDNIVAPFFKAITGVAGTIVGYFASAINWLYNAGKAILGGLWAGVKWVWDNTVAPFLKALGGAAGTIAGYFAKAVTWLAQAGKDIIGGLLGGIWTAMKDIATWIKNNIFDPIVHAVKSFFGISSPSSVFKALGVNVIEGFLAGMLKVNPLAVVKKVFGSVASAASLIFKSLGGSGNTAGISGPSPGSVSGAANAGANAAMSLAQQEAAFVGWSGAEWNALNALVMRESGWNMTARNPQSGAYGIAQGITGPNWYYQWPGGNPNTLQGQLNGLFAYIKSRYGDPAAAWAHEVGFGWYDRGGILPPGLTMALNTTGRDEYITGTPPAAAGPTIILQVDGKTLGNVVLTQLLREQQLRPLGIKAS